MSEPVEPDFITVWGANGFGLSLNRDVARALGHRDGDHLDLGQTWEALDANARHMLRVCKAAIAAKNA